MWPIIIGIAISLLTTFLFAPKMKSQTPSPGDLQPTKADEGGSIVVVFGTCDVSPNVVAFKAGTPQAIKKKA